MLLDCRVQDAEIKRSNRPKPNYPVLLAGQSDVNIFPASPVEP